MSKSFVLSELCEEHRIPRNFPLAPNTNVKVRFELKEPVDMGDGREIGSETMWVLLKEVDGDDLKGTLNNDPVVIEDLAYEDEIVFQRKHICNVLSDN